MGWKTYVKGRVERVEDDLRRLGATASGDINYQIAWRGLCDARTISGLEVIHTDLAPLPMAGSELAVPASKPSGWNWWDGNCTEEAYAALHRADGAYLLIAPDEVVRARAALIASRLATCGIPATDGRLGRYQDVLQTLAHAGGDAVSAQARSDLKEILEAVNQASDSQHYRARAFRNLLFTMALGLLVVFLVFAWLAAANPMFLSLCGATTAGTIVCPGGASTPHASDVFILGLAGMVGGAVGSVALLASVSVSSGPFTPAIAQAVLKVPAGAVLAVVGLFIMQHGVLGIIKPQPGDVLVAWAIVFGIGQQALTREIDARANAIVSGSGEAQPSRRRSRRGA